MGRRAPARSKAETSAQTRAALLEAGAVLLREQPVGTVLNQVKAAEVARRAGRTTGAFYHHWDDQESYQRELLAYALAPGRFSSTSGAIDSALADLAEGIHLEEMVRRAARQNFENVRSNPYLPLFMALWSKQGDDNEIREHLRQHYQTVTAQLVPMYQKIFDAQGLEPRPPFTVEMFAVTLTAIVEGLALRAAVDPAAVPRHAPPAQAAARQQLDGKLDEGPWDLFGLLVLALIPSMTAPKIKRDSDLWLDQEDVRGVVRRLRETYESMVGQNELQGGLRPSGVDAASLST